MDAWNRNTQNAFKKKLEKIITPFSVFTSTAAAEEGVEAALGEEIVVLRGDSERMALSAFAADRLRSIAAQRKEKQRCTRNLGFQLGVHQRSACSLLALRPQTLPSTSKVF